MAFIEYVCHTMYDLLIELPADHICFCAFTKTYKHSFHKVVDVFISWLQAAISFQLFPPYSSKKCEETNI